MEEKINIAAILKDKPNGIRLYSPIFGECSFSLVREETYDICVKKHNGVKEFFNSKGLYYNTGEVMLFPSKEMRDWGKFSWKKGDLLINSCGFQCIFKEWSSDDYTKFNGCYSNSRDGYEDVSNAETANFVKLDNNTTYEYIKEIERKLGGKLNLKTLEIEKQSEFKDGDVLFVKCNVDAFIEIFKHSKKNGGLYDHASLDTATQDLDISGKYGIGGYEITEIRLATEEEKQQLFDALAKKGKVWDAEKKKVVDIKKEHQFKPFEKVLVRDSFDDVWRASFFSHIKENDGRYVTTCVTWKFCIPYEGNEHLLGTTNNVENQV